MQNNGVIQIGVDKLLEMILTAGVGVIGMWMRYEVLKLSERNARDETALREWCRKTFIPFPHSGEDR